MKVIRTKAPGFSKQFNGILTRSREESAEVEASVRRILEDVRKNGDRAVLKYTKKFDRHSPKRLEVSGAEIREAYRRVSQKDLRALKIAAKRITEFHETQRKNGIRSWKTRRDGALLGEIVQPLQRVGIYVPGGLGAYPSTVLMNAIPARIAGVKEIVMVSPLNRMAGGMANPYTLVAADLVGVSRIFKVGGAQAIAALAFGTRSIPAVDKIVGPGNIYVATAKKLVFGSVGIDMIAGPTEVVIVADETTNPEFVAADLLSQAEHDPQALPVLIAISERLAQSVLGAVHRQLKALPRRKILEQSLKNHGLILITRSREEALDLANRIAAEHLELQVRNPIQAASKIRNAGAIFLGPYSPVALGDYIAGPNHVLPTSGTARFSSPLGVGDFLKRSSLIQTEKMFLKRLGPDIMRLAHLEGLTAHAASVEIRLRQPRN